MPQVVYGVPVPPDHPLHPANVEKVLADKKAREAEEIAAKREAARKAREDRQARGR